VNDKPDTVPEPKLCENCGAPIVEEFAGDSGCCCLECHRALGHKPKKGLNSLMTTMALAAMACAEGGGRHRAGPWAQYRCDHPKQKSKVVKARRAKNRAAKASRKKNRGR